MALTHAFERTALFSVPMLAAALALTAAGSAFAQPGFYRFSIDQDSIHGAPDFSFLNHPLTAADRVFVRDGHFYRVGPDLLPGTADDERVRLFGVNFAFGANFPEGQDAARVARRLRRLGVNLIRLHHMDSWPDANPSDANSTLTTDPYPTLNPVSIGRLRAFLDACKAEGIYVDLNLHVGYPFRPDVDGVPSITPWPDQGKPLYIFYPRMVDLQVEYAQKVLAALNLKDDPVLAEVEINNESSLVDGYEDQWSNFDTYVTGEYRAEFQRQWRQFLLTKYGTTEQLRIAWGAAAPDGPNLLNSNWQLEVHSPAQATMQQNGGEVIITVTRSDNWVIAKLTGFSVSAGQPYVAEVEIRADLAAGASGSVYWTIMQDTSPWNGEAGKDVTVTNQWQKFTLAVLPSFAMDHVGRFHLSVENAGGTVHIRNWSFHEAGWRGLGAGESFEAANIPLVPQGDIPTQARANDYLLFLVDRDRTYLATILRAIRAGAGPLVPVTGTQMAFGGFLNIDSHEDMDFRDNHFYVDHPEFPHEVWDSQDWRIHDASATLDGMAEIREAAIMRQSGLPYTVSEFNEPWPNTHGAEIDPVLAAFARFQDWDAIMHFDYQGSRDWDRGLPSWFDLDGDLTKLPAAGQSALLFRAGILNEGLEPMEIPVPPALRLRSGREPQMWNWSGFLASTIGIDPTSLFAHPVRLSKDDGPVPDSAKNAPPAPYRADTGEMSYDPGRKLFLVHAPSAAGIIGSPGVQKATAGAIDLELAPAARGFASVLVTALDGKPIANSASMLVSNPGYALRTMPGSNPPRPQGLVNYPGQTDMWTLEPEPGSTRPSGDEGAGQGPMWVERVECYLTLRATATALTVYPLDGTGARLTPLAAKDIETVAGGFRLHLQADGQPFSPWYEMVASGFATTAPVASVSAASYAQGPVAPESIVSAWSDRLATSTGSAQSLPLPVELAGTAISVRDAAGVERPAPLFYVSPGQVNYEIPAGTIPGLATVKVTAGDGTVSSSTVQIARVAPGLFMKTVDGLAAAGFQRGNSYADAAALDSTGAVVPVPIDVSTGDVYLVLYGTGIRFRNTLDAVTAQVGGLEARVVYAGPQGGVGLDQVNVLLPAALAGRGDVEVGLTVEGKPANRVRVRIM